MAPGRARAEGQPNCQRTAEGLLIDCKRLLWNTTHKRLEMDRSLQQSPKKSTNDLTTLAEVCVLSCINRATIHHSFRRQTMEENVQRRRALYGMDLRLRAKYEREGQKFDRPILTNEEIRKLAKENPEIFRWPVPEALSAQAATPATQQPPPVRRTAGSCGAGATTARTGRCRGCRDRRNRSRSGR